MELPKTDRLPQDLIEALNTIESYGLLGVGCCHITGMHNPKHFEEGMFVCDYQMSHAFMLLRHLAGFVEPRPSVAEPCPSQCGWCERHELDEPIPVQLQSDKRIQQDRTSLRPTLRTISLTRLY